MAFNWQIFQRRTLTAFVFAAVVLTGLFWNHWSFFVLVSIIHFGCWWEYFNLVEKMHHHVIHRTTRLGFMLLGYSVLLLFCRQVYAMNSYPLRENLFFPVSVAGIIMLGIGIFQSSRINIKTIGVTALGLLYISLCWGLMLDLRQYGIIFKGEGSFADFGMITPAAIIFSIWINDTMAYIVGSFIGKTPLSRVSPKKTWEGTLGGIFLAISVMGIVAVLFHAGVYETMIIAGIAALAGTFGDLLESWLKRMAGVKDSGNLMPGHGGFLDRFDSLLLATPAVWLYINLFL
jgi:phosphatidate cytidylyltransferase